VLAPQAQVSGRGSLPHMLFQAPTSGLFLAPAAESPVRSSELLGIPMIPAEDLNNGLFNEHWLL
jgi:hypothetical protein